MRARYTVLLLILGLVAHTLCQPVEPEHEEHVDVKEDEEPLEPPVGSVARPHRRFRPQGVEEVDDEPQGRHPGRFDSSEELEPLDHEDLNKPQKPQNKAKPKGKGRRHRRRQRRPGKGNARYWGPCYGGDCYGYGYGYPFDSHNHKEESSGGGGGGGGGAEGGGGGGGGR